MLPRANHGVRFLDNRTLRGVPVGRGFEIMNPMQLEVFDDLVRRLHGTSSLHHQHLHVNCARDVY